MRAIALVTDDDLARSRVDPEFRHRLVAGNLELLLKQLNRLRNGKPDAQSVKQIREGVDLAVQLAEILQRIEQAPVSKAGQPVPDAPPSRGTTRKSVSGLRIQAILSPPPKPSNRLKRLRFRREPL